MAELGSWRRGVARTWATLVALYTAVGSWLTDNLVVPITAITEEFTRSVARGWIVTFQRWLNSASSLLLSLFPGGRSEVHRRTQAQREAWQAWLRGATGTFNALLEREGFTAPSALSSPGKSGGDGENSAGDYAGARRRQARWVRRWLRRWRGSADATSPPGSRAERGGTGETGATASKRAAHPASLSRGVSLFDLPSGYAVASTVPARGGFLDDLWVQVEAALDRFFGAIRSAAAWLLASSGGSKRASAVLRRDSGAAGLFSPVPTGVFLAKWEDAHVWTASDFVLRAGYPLEEHSVTTDDGYVLTVHRIPRADAADAVLFQHGVLDTSLGWVANGSVGSQAFAAYDAGFDVWLGNARSNAPRVAAGPERAGLSYWRYSANELALFDIAAQVQHVHEVKTRELKKRDEAGGRGGRPVPPGSKEHGNDVPYRLQGVGHSLGAGCFLIYATDCCMRGRPHHLSRLILMSPAGFHQKVPTSLQACRWLLPWAASLMDRFLPGRGLGLRLPSPFLRYVTFKLSLDLNSLPALQSLVRRIMQAVLNGDVSEWDRAMMMPHYNTVSMPAVSLHTGAHFAQWSHDPAFRLYDYGSAERNRAAYGEPKPPSIAANYRLLDIPVDLVAGTEDHIVTPQAVKTHYQWLTRSKARMTYAEFNVGHMDLTFAVKPELREYVLRCLERPLQTPQGLVGPLPLREERRPKASTAASQETEP